jgi:hypothetical protein
MPRRQAWFRLHGQAVVREAAFAVFAESAGDVERQHYPVANFYFAYRGPGLHHLAQVFVAEGASGFKAGAPFVHVEVRAADVRGSDPHQHVSGMLDFGIRYFLDTDVVGSFVNYCLHCSALFLGATLQGAHMRVPGARHPGMHA